MDGDKQLDSNKELINDIGLLMDRNKDKIIECIVSVIGVVIGIWLGGWILMEILKMGVSQ